ncbi:hypothetical protein CL634_10545 [bacterium]|nr:hypothetical protein [bacterium]|tara:strand:+ start:85 stop:519 length:435 start_codon:yes stop_codon:yes gene_type:complete
MAIELMTMIGGSVVGFIFRYMAERAKEKHEIFKRALGLKEAETAAADAAAKRVPVDAGKWVRRAIVVCVLFGVILAPFILSLLGLTTIVEIQETGSEYLFGMFHGDDSIKFLELEGYLLVPEVRQTLTALVGFYFGNAAAANKT